MHDWQLNSYRQSFHDFSNHIRSAHEFIIVVKQFQAQTPIRLPTRRHDGELPSLDKGDRLCEMHVESAPNYAITPFREGTKAGIEPSLLNLPSDNSRRVFRAFSQSSNNFFGIFSRNEFLFGRKRVSRSFVPAIKAILTNLPPLTHFAVLPIHPTIVRWNHVPKAFRAINFFLMENIPMVN